MKILHVITDLHKAAGTSEFVGELANGLVASGNDVKIAVEKPDAADCHPLDEHVKLISFTDMERLSDMPDIVHLHGLWQMPMHRACRWANRHHRPIIWSPHGALSPWAMRHKRWKKILPWYLYQRGDLATAHVLHATTSLEAGWNSRFSFRAKSVVIPIGTNLPDVRAIKTRRSSAPLRVLFVGRVHPVKGLMNVIRTAALLKGAPIHFRIVGPDQAGHQVELMCEAERLGVNSMFDWVGPRFGLELSAEYDACDLLILPSFTENFGATVVQALAHAKPALASRFTPWEILEKQKCGWWVSNEPQVLAETFKSISLMSGESLQTMGMAGRKLVEEQYSWSSVASQMLRSYEMMLDPRD